MRHLLASDNGPVDPRDHFDAVVPSLPAAAARIHISRTPGLGIDPGWNAQHVDILRWALWMKREANVAEIEAELAATDDRPIVEVSTHDG